MASVFIKIDTSQPNTAIGALQLKSYIQQMRNAYNNGKQILAIMNNMKDFTVSPNLYNDLELYFGLPSGKGQTVFDLVNGSVGSMEGLFAVDDAKKITEQVG